ncbi:hypothetical protein C2G38_2191960 [Gigaspora rosea]|uniref:SWIM-type domain-containing protein n=1 Tax=Gigaspora rosea TaxID=44941 RepID=A0A397V167_9GLOM|nr:hypothetical protein C2G38_2191960 [Gigaspora rosea]
MSTIRERFFNINETFELGIEDFNKHWALVDNIWTRYNGYKLDNGDERKTFVCRLLTPKESSGRKENLSPEKLCITLKHPSIDCEARIRITWLAPSNMVRIERVNGTPDHSHLMERNDMCKRSKFIKDMVANEAIKSYKPPTITNVIKKEVSKLHEDSGVEYLKTKEVANIKHKLVGPMNSHLVGHADLNSDFLSATEFLLRNNYQVESFQKQKSHARLQDLCFANFWQIENLTHYGWLTLIDSTHNTNKHGETSMAVASALKIIQNFASRWNPRYMLLDQSSMESNGIALTFPDLFVAQQHSPLLLQITSTNPLESFHSELKAKISVQYVFEKHLDSSKSTKITDFGLLKLLKQINEPLDKFSGKFQAEGLRRKKMAQHHLQPMDLYSKLTYEIKEKKTMIKNNQVKELKIQRGNREEPIEDTPSQYIEFYKKCWDSDPANRPKQEQISQSIRTQYLRKFLETLGKFGGKAIADALSKNITLKDLNLTRACQILLELDNKKMMAAKKTATEFRTKRISLTNVRPEVLNEIHKFPFPLQRLVAEEVHAVAKRLEEGKSLPNLASAECSCRFFNWYMLLCRHIFHEQLCGANILMPEAWENFQRTFEESGIEVYQTRGIVEISAVQIFAADKAAEKTRSKMNELFERTRDCYYRLAEKSENEPSQFVGNLEKILEPAIN